MGEDPNKEVAGYYKASYGNNPEIVIFKRDKYDIKNILAVLAHESMHNYLYEKKAPFSRDELLTDLAAVYFGFGNILLKGYEPIKWYTNIEELLNYTTYTVNSISIGYINRNSIRRAIVVSSILRKYSMYQMISKLSFVDNFKVLIGYIYFRIFKKLY